MMGRNDDVLPIHFDEMHCSEEAGHVALDPFANHVHEEDNDELGQEAVPDVHEGVERIDGHVHVHDPEDGPGDDVWDGREQVVRRLVRTVLVGIDKISGQFKRELQSPDSPFLFIFFS